MSLSVKVIVRVVAVYETTPGDLHWGDGGLTDLWGEAHFTWLTVLANTLTLTACIAMKS